MCYFEKVAFTNMCMSTLRKGACDRVHEERVDWLSLVAMSFILP